MKKTLLAVVLFLFTTGAVYAKYDPRTVPNNKYGIHVADPNDIEATAPLINSSSGDWGYVTVVIPQTDRNTGKWQEIFNRMRRLHLIPIVRLATQSKQDYWIKPESREIRDWVSFLTSLNWPIENRYIVLFNEPNHANEWGGTINPEEYGAIAFEYATALKTAHEDFFILPAGLDASASNTLESMDEKIFLERLLSAKPEFIDILDGWTSHSYPNPGFSGSPYARGRGTLTTFLWELDLLSRLTQTNDVPVFITETGWSRTNLNDDTLARNLLIAASFIWKNPNIVAVTPFVYSYLTPPFDHFSWKIPGSINFYPQYKTYQHISKVAGTPKQHHNFSLVSHTFPDTFVANSTYNVLIRLKNEGQSILDRTYFHVEVKTDPQTNIHILPLPTIEPGQDGEIQFVLTVPNRTGTLSVSLVLKTGDASIILMNKDILLVPPPSLAIQTQLGFSTTNNAGDVRILVYDKEDKLVYKEEHAGINSGLIEIPSLINVSPGKDYRVVVLVGYYLPRQANITLHQNVNVVKLKRLWPLDFNNDGALTLLDIPSAFRLPPGFIKTLFFNH